MLKEYQIKLAAFNDGKKVINLLKRSAQWMKDNSINQWQYLLSGGDDEEILNAIKGNETYIVLNDQDIIATFTLSPDQSEWDRHIFGPEANLDSLYMHRLAVSPDIIGKGLGKEILDWIFENVKTDKKFLRLDCVAGNHKLNQFYQHNGFEYIGETDEHSKYQKELNHE
ncbi:GNAT family N-acetyltransferase [Mesobacillus subterraneus]|uniref:N-acetyltransferase n=1 Tax=Mesobacillus subterraneus TaxID=285983 RepID=A0A427TI50_9BACI|nr:GNAT family N-acetyltransferase [Mesobacillus subterraneus]RSD23032.1 N-acetyltransferase [Mesobacillus subterraneus]